VGDKPQWHGVKHIQISSTDFGCVSIGSGMNEADHERGYTDALVATATDCRGMCFSALPTITSVP
jgi:hypothetical protein